MRVRSLLTPLLLAGALVACGPDGREVPDPDRPVSTAFYCPGGDRDAHCYLLGDVASVYCLVQQARAAVRAGRLEAADLPAWSDPSDVDGAPRIVDLREPPADRSSAESADEIAAAMTEAGVEVDGLESSRCARGISAEKIARTEER